MNNFIAYLREASDNLADLMEMPRTDWDSLIQTATDEELEEMILVWKAEHPEGCYN